MPSNNQIKTAVQEEMDHLRENHLEVLEFSIVDWAKERGIFDASDPIAQLSCTIEECAETLKELNKVKDVDKSDLDEVILEYGDILVTLIIGMNMLELDMSTCLTAAYNKIVKRKGKMIDGKFVKEEDLEDD